MRVSANTFSDTLITQLGNLSGRQQRLQSQAATGQRVRLPEDDPVALRRLVPEPLELTEPVVNFEFIRMPDSTDFRAGVKHVLRSHRDSG